jgi:general secretion pathway protein G
MVSLRRSSAAGGRGFTLVEMLAVIMIIMILAGIALPQFRVAIVRAREAALKEDLYRLRGAIDQYHADKGKYPSSVQALMEEGYLRKREPDPMTGADDWVEVQSEPDADNPNAEAGISDVHSASESVSSEGTAYSEW